jgi:hypothetical protein
MTELDRLRQICAVASEMRARQRAYFRTRRPEHLEGSKLLETKLDRMIRENTEATAEESQGRLL